MPNPDDSYTLEDAIRDQLDAHHLDTIEAFATFCAERMEVPQRLIGGLILELVGNRRWETTRSAIGQRNCWVAEALAEITADIRQLEDAFITYEALRRTAQAEAEKVDQYDREHAA